MARDDVVPRPPGTPGSSREGEWADALLLTEARGLQVSLEAPNPEHSPHPLSLSVVVQRPSMPVRRCQSVDDSKRNPHGMSSASSNGLATSCVASCKPSPLPERNLMVGKLVRLKGAM